MTSKRYITIPKDYFKDMNFKIQGSPFGDKLCCCGYKNCINLECLIHSIEHDKINKSRN